MKRDWLNKKNWLYTFYEHWFIKTSEQRSFERLIKILPKSKFDMGVIKEKGKEYVSSLGELLGLEMYLEYLEYIEKENQQRKLNPSYLLNRQNLIETATFNSQLEMEMEYIKSLLSKENGLEVIDEPESITQNNDKKTVKAEKKQPKSDIKRVKEFIDLAMKLGEIPKGENYITKTMYRKLSSEQFLVLLVTELSKKHKSKFSYSEDKRKLLKEMKDFYSAKGTQIINSDSKKKEKQINNDKSKETELFDDYDYTNS